MDLVHDIDPHPDGGGGVHCLVPQGPDLVHPVVGGGVQLQHVQDGAVLYPQTGRALVAGVAVLGVLAVHRPGQDLGAGSLARPPGAGEQIGVRQPSHRRLALQGVGDVLLAHHVVKGAGPPLAVQRLIHFLFTSCFQGSSKNGGEAAAQTATQRSGCRLERRGNEMTELSPFGGSEGYEVCLDEEQDRTPAFEARDIPVTWTAGSRPVDPRHTRPNA